MTEVSVPHAVGESRAQCNRMAGEGPADAYASGLKRNLAVLIDFAHLAVGGVFNSRQRFRECARARAIACGRRGAVERLVRAFEVIDIAPVIEAALRGLQIGEVLAGEYFGLQRAMEAFVF